MVMDKIIVDKLQKYIDGVKHVDGSAETAASVYNDNLIKPPHSMGELENIAIRLAGITGHIKNVVGRKEMVVFCADNGVIAEGVASSPITVTSSQAVNMTKGITGMSALARHVGADITVVDVGIATEYPEDCGIVCKSIRKGTGNIAREDAMTQDECVQAIITGIETVTGLFAASQCNETDSGVVDIVGVGEMGVGNTTTATAVLAAITGEASDKLVGRGAGLTDGAYSHKKEIIRELLEFHKLEPISDNATLSSVVDIISQVGGLDIAAMCGAFIGAAYCKRAVVIDGLISAVAALCSVKMCPEIRSYLFPSHASKEVAYKLVMKELGMEPWLLLNMGLGEGSGCPLAFQIIENACVMMNDMATFQGGGIDDSYLEGIR